MSAPNVLITGANGYIGARALRALIAQRQSVGTIIALDIRPPRAQDKLEEVTYITGDIRDPGLDQIMKAHAITAIVHLASIVSPGRKSDRQFEYSVDVLGTRNLLEAAIAADVRHLTLTSSGAAYGYYPDNPDWITEETPLRGNPEFAYSDHKRQVEEMLRAYRNDHPALRQLILRPCTVLGSGTQNQITALFEKPCVLRLAGASTPFVFIWDEDLAACIVKGVTEQRAGIYNVAGDGALTLAEIAAIMRKPTITLPPALLAALLRLLRLLGLTQYGPEQVNFLRYRPVLLNEKLKKDFGYVPQKTSRQAFEYYLQNRP